MKIHELKLQQPYFDDVWYNRKEFEVRKNDRDFMVGDRLKLLKYPSENGDFVMKEIKYILQGGQFGIEEGYVILGLKEISVGKIIPAEKLAEINCRIEIYDKIKSK